MDLGIQGKVALVTAASRGLGRAIAERLAMEGAKVVISSRSEERLMEASKEISERTGQEVDYVPADVGHAEEIAQLVRYVVQKYGRVHMLVNNSGGPPGGKFFDFDDGAWEDAFQRNLMSVVRLIRAAVPHMDEGGRILTIASSSVRQPLPNLILSNTMRAGVAGLMKSLAEELAPRNILLNTLLPGRIATDRLIELDALRARQTGQSVEEVAQQAAKAIPLKRYGTPEEFAQVAAFLLSWANTYVTGQALLVDGGLVRSL